MRLHGFVTDKNNLSLPGVLVEIKNSEFQTIYSAETDQSGYYEIELTAGFYPFLTAVRDYGERYLEYWCHNLKLDLDTELNIKIDTIEIYGLNYFRIAGAFPALMVYFRPMSLQKFLTQAEDVAPDIEKIDFSVNQKKCAILKVNSIEEYIGERSLRAYLVQIEEPENHWNKLDLEITDFDGNYGAASIFWG